MLTTVWRSSGVATQGVPTLGATDQSLQQKAASFSPDLRAPLIISQLLLY
jgi:hypothetical protein